MSLTASLLVLALAGLLLVTFPGLCAGTAAAHHRPNGNQCHPSGSLEGPSTGHICGECCKPGHLYPKYQCSPPVTKSTRAVMTLNNFEEGGDGGDPSECDGKYHYNTERVVALSTGWYNHGKRCGKNIRINAKGRSVLAKVVDRDDVLVRQLARGSGLTEEPLAAFSVFFDRRRDHLDGDDPLQQGILRAVDDSHATLAKLFEELIAADRRHGW